MTTVNEKITNKGQRAYIYGYDAANDAIKMVNLDASGNIIASFTAAIVAEIDQGVMRTQVENVTDAEVIVALAAECKTFTITNSGSKIVSYRFNGTDDYVNLDPDESFGDVMKTSSVYVKCPTAADTSEVQLKYTV